MHSVARRTEEHDKKGLSRCALTYDHLLILVNKADSFAIIRVENHFFNANAQSQPGDTGETKWGIDAWIQIDGNDRGLYLNLSWSMDSLATLIVEVELGKHQPAPTQAVSVIEISDDEGLEPYIAASNGRNATQIQGGQEPVRFTIQNARTCPMNAQGVDDRHTSLIVPFNDDEVIVVKNSIKEEQLSRDARAQVIPADRKRRAETLKSPAETVKSESSHEIKSVFQMKYSKRQKTDDNTKTLSISKVNVLGHKMFREDSVIAL